MCSIYNSLCFTPIPVADHSPTPLHSQKNTLEVTHSLHDGGDEEEHGGHIGLDEVKLDRRVIVKRKGKSHGFSTNESN